MTIRPLTNACVEHAKPRRKIYIIRDRKLKGFQLRVTPTGQRHFAIETTRGGIRHYENIGDADKISVAEARSLAEQKIEALALATQPRSTSFSVRGGHTPSDHVSFAALAELAFNRRTRLWKASTLRVNHDYLKNQIMPFFKDKIISEISRDDVRVWYAGLSHMPEGANRAVPVLSVIMNEAENMGLRPEGSNPAIGLRRYKNRVRNRVLTLEEMARLGTVLQAYQERYPIQVAALKMIILTGCRKNEIIHLRWRDYREGHLHLADSKTGPKKVFLSSPAREVLDGLNTKRGRYMFPGEIRGKPITGPGINYVWYKVRDDAELGDVRLHDFRHHYASTAIRNGENVSTIGRLLGHQKAESTLRYAHLNDSMMFEAIATISASMTNSETVPTISVSMTDNEETGQ